MVTILLCKHSGLAGSESSDTHRVATVIRLEVCGAVCDLPVWSPIKVVRSPIGVVRSVITLCAHQSLCALTDLPCALTDHSARSPI